MDQTDAVRKLLTEPSTGLALADWIPDPSEVMRMRVDLASTWAANTQEWQRDAITRATGSLLSASLGEAQIQHFTEVREAASVQRGPCGRWLADGSKCGREDAVMDGRLGWRCPEHSRSMG